MLLKNKNAVIYGAGGAIGSAVAGAFARDGARLFLAGRTLEKIDSVTNEIRAGLRRARRLARLTCSRERENGRHGLDR